LIGLYRAKYLLKKVATWLKCEERYCQRSKEFVTLCSRDVFRRVVRMTFFLVMILLLTACSLLNSSESGLTLDTKETLFGSAILMCDSSCSERGQCGESERGEMVLLNSEMPATFGHDMTIPDGIEVEIVGQEERSAVQLSDNEQFTVPFYLVDHPDYGQGWVAGWCIGQ